MQRIRTAVFPVAGRGTRFLPATKASPKEMLPIVDKPLIQYAVDEALAAGAERLDLRHRLHQARDRGPFRHRRRARAPARRVGQARAAVLGAQRRAGERHLYLHPPGRAARSRSCGAVRQTGGRRRAVLRAPRRRLDLQRRSLPEADECSISRSMARACSASKPCRPTRRAATASSRPKRTSPARSASRGLSKSRSPRTRHRILPSSGAIS